MLCSKCGTDLPEGAQFCLKCGNPVSIPAKTVAAAGKESGKESAPVVEVIPPMPPRRRPKRHVVFWVLLVLVVTAIVWVTASDNPYAQGVQELVGAKHDQIILDAPFSVGAHTFRYYKFALPEGSMNVAMLGQFTVSNDVNKSGNRNGANQDSTTQNSKDAESGIEVYVLSETAFTVWQNGYATSSVYESGRVSEAKIHSELSSGPGIYYLVFNNKFAPKTAKNINASVLLRYKSWLPESFRGMKDRLWNWLGL